MAFFEQKNEEWMFNPESRVELLSDPRRDGDEVEAINTVINDRVFWGICARSIMHSAHSGFRYCWSENTHRNRDFKSK